MSTAPAPSSPDPSTVGSLVELLEETYPPSWAESWDRVGLVLGERAAAARRVLLAVDPTLEVADEAVDLGADLVITHHPLLLRGANFLPADQGKGAIVTSLLRAGTALWCGHTNVDRSTRGTVGAWIDALGMDQALPLVAPTAPATAAHGSVLFGLGAVGRAPAPTTVGQLTSRIAGIVPSTARGILHTGSPDRPVTTVAVCPGAGDAFLADAAATGADVYLTSDLRHHPALEHVEAAADPSAVPALIDVPHAASETLWLPIARELLTRAVPGLDVRLSEHVTDPWGGRAG